MRVDAARQAPAMYVRVTELPRVDNDLPHVQLTHDGGGLRVSPDDARTIGEALISAANETDRIADALR